MLGDDVLLEDHHALLLQRSLSPDSGPTANDSAPRTRVAFTLGPRLAAAEPASPNIAGVVACRQKTEREDYDKYDRSNPMDDQ